ncbi:hypothetical protein [Shewanella woodyi]|uniref:hypothetical protein n=1 Tax=Shewanella woodyi TaxID=60961 RepID=UPI0007F91555|nr:hypothetical protein [Shewanella woodyi]
MQEDLPITIAADGQFSSALKPLLMKLEMWINFQALKADWYGNEDFILSFDFTLVRSLDEKVQQITATGADSNESAESWVVKQGYAYHYQSSHLMTIAFIAVDDLLEDGVGIEQAIKDRMTSVANVVASQHGLLAVS